MVEIKLERLLLRPVYIEDAADIFEYSKSALVGPNAGWKPHETIKETADIIEMMFMEQETIWGIAVQPSRKLIGVIGLVDDPKRQNKRAKMLGYALSDRYWGKGYMTEAAHGVIRYGFQQCGCELISAYCYPDNVRSKRVIEKCGFFYEGTLKRAEQLFNGTVKDNDCYALTDKQYARLF